MTSGILQADPALTGSVFDPPLNASLAFDPILVEIGAAQGMAGPPGPQGASYGYVRYAQMAAAGPMALDAGVRYLVSMTLDPTQTVNQLQGPFASHVFWDGGTFRVHHASDDLRVRFGLSATATVAGGILKLEAQIIGAPTPLDNDDKILPSQAGTVERLNFKLDIFAGSNFAANGLQFFLTSSVPATVQNETIKVTPDFAGS